MKAMFGEYIRQLRTDKGLTLTELAALLKLDSANLSKIENGKREFDEKRLEKLATAFDLDIEKLKVEYFGDQFAKKMYA
jgi:transcriptional regulator with XRE-family HTH domain